MQTIIKLIKLFFIVLILLYTIDFINTKYYERKFDSIKPNAHLITIINDWGKPDRIFIYKDLDNAIIYQYNKDFIGWEDYIFIFNPKDSLLISKNIDD